MRKMRIMESINNKETEKKEVDALKSRLKDLQASISRLRKNGVDTSLTDIKIMASSPKIQIAEVTLLKQDIDKAKKYLDEVEAEINEK